MQLGLQLLSEGNIAAERLIFDRSDQRDANPTESYDQLRDQRREERRSQGPRYWPPFAPWVQGGARAGWVWSGGPNLAPGPLGSVAGPRPVPGLAPLPLLRTGAWRPGAEAARVLSS